jgi:hypothetical protein
MVFGSVESHLLYSENGTDMGGAEGRVRDLEEGLREIGTLDGGTTNPAEADDVGGGA